MHEREETRAGNPRRLVLARIVAFVLLAVFLGAAKAAAWNLVGPGSAPPGQPLAIVTETSPNDSGICLAASLGPGRIRAFGPSGIYLLLGAREVEVTWPYGTTARLEDGNAQLFAPDGIQMTSADGSLPVLGGGFLPDHRFHVCSIGSRSY